MILDLKRRLLFLLFVFVIGYFVFSVVSGLVMGKFGVESTLAMRILSMFQDIFLFIIPAVVTAVFVTRQPATLLAIDRRPPMRITLLGISVLIVAIPAMNVVIWANEQLSLPENLAETFRAMEERAATMVQSLTGPHNVSNLIVSILIVGVFAGFSEELIFRGAFQRLMATGGVKAHTAIWIAAAVFSLMHFQPYGFLPRLMLGAFFGYALYWSGSLWTAIILHSTNNILFLLSDYFWPGSNDPHLPATMQIISSVVLTLLVLMAMHRRKQSQKSEDIELNKATPYKANRKEDNLS